MADPTTVVFYNAGEEYRRRGIDRRGDHCDYFSLRPEVMTELVAQHDPDGRGVRGGTFPFGWGPVSPDLYLWQRRLVDALLSDTPPEPLLVEEGVVAVVALATRQAATQGMPPAPQRAATARRHRDLVERAKQVLLARSAERISLNDVADAVAASPCPLARLFTRHTGFAMHEFLTQLRLRRALEYVADPTVDLSTLALELGFSSHTHFTRTFRRALGMPPSALRNAGAAHLAEMRKIVTV